MAFNQHCGEDKKTGYTFRGKEIILTQHHGRTPSGLVAMGMERGVFTPDKEIEIATVFAVTGDVHKTAELTKAQPQHIRKLLKTDGFRSLLKEIREENAERFDAKFTEIVEKTQDQLVDRVENGEVYIAKDGSHKRVPVKARDLTLITAIAFDKLQLQRGKPTSRVETTSGNARLEALAETFIKLAHKADKRSPVVIEDAEVIEVKNEPTQTELP